MPISTGTPSGGGGGAPSGPAGGGLTGTYPDPTLNIDGQPSKATPVDADEMPLADSAAAFATKKLTWANLKAAVKAYTDTLYPSGSGTSTGTNTGDQTSVSGNAGTATKLQTARTIDGQSFDGSANVTVIAPGTDAAPSKTTPVDADELPLVDSAAANVLKKLTWANVKATLKTYFDTLYVTSVSARTGAVTYTANQVTKASPGSNSASASELMAGIAGSITPVGTRIYIAIAGTYGMSLTTASVKLQGRYGTGAAPVLDAASTGTAFGLQMQTLETAATSRGIPFTLIGLVSGLTAGTAYWLDVGVTGDGTNIPTLKYCTVVAFDV